MSVKRRDNKNRILQNGESQRPDGRYRYKYIDANGKEKNLYSWRLVSTDKVPAGVKNCEPLRDMIRRVQADLNFGIVPYGGVLTVVQMCEKYLLTQNGIRENTRANHKTVMNILKKHPFGSTRIDKIKVLDAKLFLVSLQKDDGRSYSSIHSIRGVLRPAFQLALESDYIKRNPFDFQLKDVLVNDAVTREAISRQDEKKFLKFVKEDQHFSVYYDAIYILFKTGMRISEFCGLTLADIDLEQRTINIDHQLQRKGNGELYILDGQSLSTKTKTPSGTRCIPMLTNEVHAAFRNLVQNRKTPKVEPLVDGYGGFLILNEKARKGLRPMVAMDWEHIFKRILDKYNNTYKVQMPKVTPHVCRHTFCNNMANSGMNPAHLQYYMGHSDISVTMKHYVHTKTEDTRQEGLRLMKEGKLANFR